MSRRSRPSPARQAEKLAARLGDMPQVIVDWGMRYGLPPTGERIKALKDQGCDRILLFPLYPQYQRHHHGHRPRQGL